MPKIELTEWQAQRIRDLLSTLADVDDGENVDKDEIYDLMELFVPIPRRRRVVVEARTARITVVRELRSNKWEARVTFDVPWREGVMKDALEWSYFRPRSRSYSRVVTKAVKALSKDHELHHTIEIITKEESC